QPALRRRAFRQRGDGNLRHVATDRQQAEHRRQSVRVAVAAAVDVDGVGARAQVHEGVTGDTLDVHQVVAAAGVEGGPGAGRGVADGEVIVARAEVDLEILDVL